MDENKYCSISQAIIWIINKTDPVDAQTASKLDFEPIINNLNSVQLIDAINRIIAGFELGKIRIFADIVVMKSLRDRDVVEYARDETTGMEFNELNEGHLRYYEVPRIYKDLGRFKELPRGAIHTLSVFASSNSIDIPDEISEYSLPEPELNKRARKSLFKYWLCAQNCRIAIRDLKNYFPEPSPAKAQARAGRHAQYEWDGAWVNVIKYVHTNGFPKQQARIEEAMKDYFIGQGMDPPSTSEIRKKARLLFSRRNEFVD